MDVWCFVSKSYWKTQVLSPITIYSKGQVLAIILLKGLRKLVSQLLLTVDIFCYHFGTDFLHVQIFGQNESLFVFSSSVIFQTFK